MYLQKEETATCLHIVFAAEQTIKKGRILNRTKKWVFVESDGRLYKFRIKDMLHRYILCTTKEEAEQFLLYIEQYTRLQAGFQPPWYCSPFTLQQLQDVQNLIGCTLPKHNPFISKNNCLVEDGTLERRQA